MEQSKNPPKRGSASPGAGVSAYGLKLAALTMSKYEEEFKGFLTETVREGILLRAPQPQYAKANIIRQGVAIVEFQGIIPGDICGYLDTQLWAIPGMEIQESRIIAADIEQIIQVANLTSLIEGISLLPVRETSYLIAL